MAIMDDIKQQWRNMREKPLKERIAYFLSYYKWYAVACIGVIAVLVGMLIGNLLQKETVISGVMLNSTNASSQSAYDDFSQRFLDEMELSNKDFKVSITSNLTYLPNSKENAENNYATVQSLLAQTSGALLDFVVGNLSSAQNLAYSRFFMDLSKVLSQEQMQRFAPYIHYIDLAVIEKIDEAVASGNYDVDIKIPDSKKPEEMEQPVAAFIDVSASQWLSDIYTLKAEPIVFGVAENAPRKEAIQRLIDCLLPQ